MRRTATIFAAAVAVAALSGACNLGGDDDDFSDIQATATAVAQRTPSPSPTAAATEASGDQSPSPAASPSPAQTQESTATPTAGGTAPTATPTSPPATATTPAGDPTASYTASVRALTTELKRNVAKLKDDMFFAQTRQNDPATEELLRSDIRAVDGNIASIRALQVPPSLASFAAELEKALAELKRGTEALTRAIDNEDQLAGLTAFTALNNGESMLDDALKKLP